MRAYAFFIGMMAAGLVITATSAEEACEICNADVVTNSDLAACLLSNYEAFAQGTNPVVAVDLSDCEMSRNVEPLAMPAPSGPTAALREPDLKFLITRPQLTCLCKKLQEPGLVMDPVVKIELKSCG